MTLLKSSYYNVLWKTFLWVSAGFLVGAATFFGTTILVVTVSVWVSLPQLLFLGVLIALLSGLAFIFSKFVTRYTANDWCGNVAFYSFLAGAFYVVMLSANDARIPEPQWYVGILVIANLLGGLLYVSLCRREIARFWLRGSLLGLGLMTLILPIVVPLYFSELMLSRGMKKGPDVYSMMALSQSRAQAEIYFNNTGSYEGVCSADAEAYGIKELLSGIKGEVLCVASAEAWAAEVELTQAQGFFCVDYTGQTVAYEVSLLDRERKDCGSAGE